jgi:hypothetical protein
MSGLTRKRNLLRALVARHSVDGKQFASLSIVANSFKSDLLLRHEKLVHSNDLKRNSGRPNLAGIPSLAPHLPENLSFNVHVNDSIENTGSSSGPLDNLRSEPMPNASHQVASSDNLLRVGVPQVGFFKGQANKGYFGNVSNSEADFSNPNFQLPGPADLSEDYNLFLDDFDGSSFYLPSSFFDSELPTSLWCRPDSDVVLESQSRNRYWEASQDEHNPLSRFGSRLPSLQPEEQDLLESVPAPQADNLRLGPPWKISGRDHREVQIKLVEFSAVLPQGFTLPSRHTLSRFIEGYISGFHQHLPFLHIPTLIASKCVPELLLAIVAVGAQYRFESNKGNNLWYAARAIAFEQTRRRHSQKVEDILSSPMSRSTSYSKSPMSTGGAAERSGEPAHIGTQDDEDTRGPHDPRSVSRAGYMLDEML